MPTVVLDPPPAAFERLLRQRSEEGLDRRDEVWEGVLHVNPPASTAHELIASHLHVLLRAPARDVGLTLVGSVGIGTDEHDYRVPDLAMLRPPLAVQWHETAALVVEILSPGDESRDKLSYYARRGVEEILIVDPRTRSIEWLSLTDGQYRRVEHSGLLGLSPVELNTRIDWPPTA